MDSNKKKFLAEIEKHKNELVLDYFKVVRLVGFDEDDLDYYYVFNDGRNRYSSSCVGKFIPLKGIISDKDYEHLDKVFDLNDIQKEGKKYFIDKIKKASEEMKNKESFEEKQEVWNERVTEIQKEMLECKCTSQEILEIFFEATYDGI